MICFMKALVCIYNPADLFPPTLNAVRTLSSEFDEVVLITTRQDNEEMNYFPGNVKLVYPLRRKRSERPTLPGMLAYLRFTFEVWKYMMRTRFHLVLMYDPHAWLSVIISRVFFALGPGIKWYHNHDIYQLSNQRRFSAAWFALKQEAKAFRKLDVFSLPANERKKYFPMDELGGAYFFIPNYPSSQFMQNYPGSKPAGQVIRLIYQGRIAEGHGLESIIEMISLPVNGKQLQLVLKGFIDPRYKSDLKNKATREGVLHQLEFHGPSAYSEVPRITSGCQIGLAIHQNTDIMTTTLGTSSNKIYEYAALGLPVILFDTPHFRNHLGRFTWTYFTDCSRRSLLDCIKEIDSGYLSLSSQAREDFLRELNFETNFRPAIAYCKQILGSSQTVPAS